MASPRSDQPSLIWDLQRNIFKYPGIICHNLTNHTVPSGNSLHKFPVFIRKNHCKSIQLPGKQRLVFPYKLSKNFPVFRLIQRKHGGFMFFFGKLLYGFISYADGGTVCQNGSRFFFQSLKLVVHTDRTLCCL